MKVVKELFILIGQIFLYLIGIVIILGSARVFAGARGLHYRNPAPVGRPRAAHNDFRMNFELIVLTDPSICQRSKFVIGVFEGPKAGVPARGAAL